VLNPTVKSQIRSTQTENTCFLKSNGYNTLRNAFYNRRVILKKILSFVTMVTFSYGLETSIQDLESLTLYSRTPNGWQDITPGNPNSSGYIVAYAKGKDGSLWVSGASDLATKTWGNTLTINETGTISDGKSIILKTSKAIRFDNPFDFIEYCDEKLLPPLYRFFGLEQGRTIKVYSDQPTQDDIENAHKEYSDSVTLALDSLSENGIEAEAIGIIAEQLDSLSKANYSLDATATDTQQIIDAALSNISANVQDFKKSVSNLVTLHLKRIANNNMSLLRRLEIVKINNREHSNYDFTVPLTAFEKFLNRTQTKVMEYIKKHKDEDTTFTLNFVNGILHHLNALFSQESTPNHFIERLNQLQERIPAFHPNAELMIDLMKALHLALDTKIKYPSFPQIDSITEWYVSAPSTASQDYLTQEHLNLIILLNNDLYLQEQIWPHIGAQPDEAQPE
jgi:hypothetical protein